MTTLHNPHPQSALAAARRVAALETDIAHCLAAVRDRVEHRYPHVTRRPATQIEKLIPPVLSPPVAGTPMQTPRHCASWRSSCRPMPASTPNAILRR